MIDLTQSCSDKSEKWKTTYLKQLEDAINSLKIVLKRAFGCLSIETKRTKDGPVQYISCANAKPKTKEAKHHCTRLPHTVNMPVTANCNFFFFFEKQKNQ